MRLIAIYYYSICYFQRKPKPTKEVITIGIYEGEYDPEDYNDLLWDTVEECLQYEEEGFPYKYIYS